MVDKPATVEKDFSSSFALDKSKLSRMLNILEEKFTASQLQFNPRYAVRLSNDKKIELTSADELFALDNAIRNPIKSLTINTVDSTKETNIEATISYDGDDEDNITVRVTSNNSGLALQTFAELEEQVERTFLNNWVYRFFKSRYATLYLGGLGVVTGMAASTVALFLSQVPLGRLITYLLMS